MAHVDTVWLASMIAASFALGVVAACALWLVGEIRWANRWKRDSVWARAEALQSSEARAMVNAVATGDAKPAPPPKPDWMEQ